MIGKIKELLGFRREDKTTENFYIRVIEYGIKHPDGFTYNEIIDNKELDLKDWEKESIKKYFNNAFINSYRDESKSRSGDAETLFLIINKGGSSYDSRYVINFDCYFKYIDYQELKLAQKNAKTAKKLSLWAIIIALLSIITAILIPIFVRQTVKIDMEQVDQILRALRI
jgi:hypothetical protein